MMQGQTHCQCFRVQAMAGEDSLETDVAQWLYLTRVFVGLWCRVRRTPNSTGCR